MRVIQVSIIALALWLIAATWVQRTVAGAPDDRPAIAVAERLATQSELDAVSLNIVDAKLALSLAVEVQIQIELSELTLAGIHDDVLKRFAEKKLRFYRQLLSDLDELTGGQSGRMLARASGKTQAPVTSSESASPAAARGNSGSLKSGRKSGLGDVMQNVTTHAILRVRLEIADEYAHLLRAELNTAPPDEYDRRYLGIEVHNQMQVLAMLRVFEKQASAPFSRITRSAAVAAESHAAEARQVMEQLQTAPQIPPAGPSQIVNASKTAGS